VAPVYAAILSVLAFLTAIARGVLHNGNPDRILTVAWLSLLVFAAVGYFAGRLAEWIVDESVRTRMAAEMAAGESVRTRMAAEMAAGESEQEAETAAEADDQR